MIRIAVVGAGAAGMTAAVFAGRNGADVTVYEKMDRPGRKLRITGKGRCNVTNDSDPAECMKNVVSNPKFLYAAFNAFPPADVMAFFESLGVPLKTERGRRVFPVSDCAQDVVDALAKAVRDAGCRIVHETVSGIYPPDGDAKLRISTASGTHEYDRVIVATGGASYPATGSTGDGYRFARALGIGVTDIEASLVPLVTEENVCPLMGLSLKNVNLSVTDAERKNKKIFSEQGEMLFTHFGMSGPLVLSASSHLRSIVPGRYTAYIDLKPALDAQTLDRRVLSDFAKYANRDLINALGDLLPAKMIPYLVARSGIDPHRKVNEITKEMRKTLVDLFKNLPFSIRATRPIAEAIVTAGGVNVKEIDPSTMESKAVPGLYFAGEVLDVDAYTGGYNLEIAFSTGMLAGTKASN